MDVALLRWPKDEARRGELAEAGRPRLLLVDAGAPAPEVTDPLEDWTRLPTPSADVEVRLQTLAVRATREPARPELDGDGVLHVGERSVVLPPIEERLARELVDRFGVVVSRDALMRAGWPEGVANRNLLDVRILRLRRRLAPLGLELRTVRHRGYLLTAS